MLGKGKEYEGKSVQMKLKVKRENIFICIKENSREKKGKKLSNIIS